MEKGRFIGYQAWVETQYSLEEYNTKYNVNYSNYREIPMPHKSEPAMEDMYAFFDDFLNIILKNTQRVLPNVSMEVRMDWDVFYRADGSMDFYKHHNTFTCQDSDYTATMYGIPMGFENVGERVTYVEALEKTRYILEQLKINNEGKPVYIEQFIFADNTPIFAHNARIKEEDLNLYLENVADVLLEFSEGYGIWTYRNYCANMVYNSQFALQGEDWEYDSNVVFEEIKDSMVCTLAEGAYIKQTIAGIRNHFNAEEYTFEISVADVEQIGELTISVGEEKQSLEVKEEGKYSLTFPKNSSFDITIEATKGDISIDNIKLYSQIQEGYLYDKEGNELQCITGIRSLNSKLQ